MKKILPLMLLGIFALISCKKTEIIIPDPPAFLNPKQEQWGLVINYTATWCGPCGSSGATAVANAGQIDKAVVITNHVSGDPMYNATLYNSMTADRKTGGGVPAFWVGDSKVVTSQVVTTLTQQMNNTPIAGIDMKTNHVNNKMNVAAQVKFFSQGTGDYYLSFWLLETGIDGSSSAGSYAQTGATDPNYKHKYVLRTMKDNKAYGDKILTSPAAGTTHDIVFSFDVNALWTKDLSVAACLWKYDASGDPANFIPNYKYINGFVVK
jgi:hypothetical protein